MIKKLALVFIILGFVSIIAATMSVIGFKFYIHHQAKTTADAIILQTLQDKKMSADEEIILLARYVATHFVWREPSEVLLLRARSYLTNARLPHALRISDGAIETLIQTGFCDNAARMLSFILKQRGYTSVQWNMVTNTNAHSALSVTMPDGRNVLVDPFYGYVAFDKTKNALTSAQDAQDRLKAGAETDDVLQALSDQSHPDFYKKFASAFMSAQGTPLEIVSSLPYVSSDLELGSIDGSSEDVKSQVAQYNMTPFWDYIGHKYNREWVRILTASQDITLEIRLVAPPEDNIMTASPAPKIQDNSLIWSLKAGDKITFRDGLAKVSYRRLNSYIGVDQIIIRPEIQK